MDYKTKDEANPIDNFTRKIKVKGIDWIGIKYLYLGYWLAVKPDDEEPFDQVYLVKEDRK